MDSYLRKALENVLNAAARCGRDNLNYINFLEGHLMDELDHQYAKECRKHGRPRKKVTT